VNEWLMKFESIAFLKFASKCVHCAISSKFYYDFQDFVECIGSLSRSNPVRKKLCGMG
jgi:hypothetical protein